MRVSAPLKWETTVDGLVLSGDLTASQVPRLAAEVPTPASTTTGGDAMPGVDLGGISRVDSAGVALLLHWAQSLGETHSLLLKNAPDQLRQLVAIFHLDTSFRFSE